MAARSSRELTVRGSVDSPVGEIPWFLCASAEELHARGPLPVKEIAIYYDRWEGEGSLCSLQDTDRDFPSFPIDTSRGAKATNRDRRFFCLRILPCAPPFFMSGFLLRARARLRKLDYLSFREASAAEEDDDARRFARIVSMLSCALSWP